MAVHHFAGLIGLLDTVPMTWLLVKGTGKKLLESAIGELGPGYADHVRRTSGFLPLPPREAGS